MNIVGKLGLRFEFRSSHDFFSPFFFLADFILFKRLQVQKSVRFSSIFLLALLGLISIG